MADNLTNDQQNWILKQYWKTGNARKVQQKWAIEFDTLPPSRQTIYRIRDKFDGIGSICSASKSGQPVSVTTQEASTELGISCRSLSRLMQRLGLKIYRPRSLHGL
jgi:hypothetical protein